MPITPDAILSLDVGAKRVGVAVASAVARLPRPLITLQREANFFEALQTIAEVERAGALVVGFPRGLRGQHTAQTASIEAFITELKQHFALPIHLQDEALTSKHAEAELRAGGRPFDRGAIDAFAATYILEDFLSEHPNIAQELADATL